MAKKPTKKPPAKKSPAKGSDVNVRKVRWKPPEGMPAEIAYYVSRGLMCGYRLQNGSYCEDPSFPGQRGLPRPHFCRQHVEGARGQRMPTNVGLSGSGASPINGLYSKAFLNQDEADRYRRILGLVSLDEEIAFTRIRLERAVSYEAKLEAALEEKDSDRTEALMLLEEHRHERLIVHRPAETNDDGSVTPARSFTVEEKIVMAKRLRNCEAMIDKLVSQLVKLLAQKQAQEGGGSELTPQERAQMSRELLRQAREDAANGDAA